MTLASDMPMRSVAVVAKVLGLVGALEQSAHNATNKVNMRECLKDHNVPIPEFHRIDSREDYWKALNSFKKTGAKCIVKPADNSGGSGVKVITDFENINDLNSVYDYSKSYSRNGEILVEEYMEVQK